MAFPSRTRKGFGLKIEDPSRAATYGLERMGLVSGAIPKTFLDHEQDIPLVDGERFIHDQQATSSCTAQAFVAAMHLKETRVGLPFDRISCLYPYYNGRREHGGHLWDGGTYLYTLAHGLRKFGACSEIDWQWSQLSFKVNRRPNWKAMRYAHPRRGGRYVRIYEQGPDRIQAIQTAILNGNDVAFGTALGVSFQNTRGGAFIEVPPLTEKIAGNHAMLIIGWKTFVVAGIERLYFRVLNSWGDSWKDGGLCWMSEEYIRWYRTQDCHVVYGWERLQETS